MIAVIICQVRFIWQGHEGCSNFFEGMVSLGSTKSRNVRIDGRRTSVRLEDAEWEALAEICAAESMTMRQICTEVDRKRPQGAFTSGLRVFILNYFRLKAKSTRRRAGPMGIDQIWSV